MTRKSVFNQKSRELSNYLTKAIASLDPAARLHCICTPSRCLELGLQRGVLYFNRICGNWDSNVCFYTRKLELALAGHTSPLLRRSFFLLHRPSYQPSSLLLEKRERSRLDFSFLFFFFFLFSLRASESLRFSILQRKCRAQVFPWRAQQQRRQWRVGQGKFYFQMKRPRLCEETFDCVE